MNRILIVDDSSSARAVMRTTLEAEGYAVIEAANGVEAVQLLVSDPRSEPCLIVLNLEMPTMSGWEFVRLVKSYHRLASIPLLVVSAHDPAGLPEGGIAGYLRKPFESAQLLAAVRACVTPRPWRTRCDGLTRGPWTILHNAVRWSPPITAAPGRPMTPTKAGGVLRPKPAAPDQ